MNAFFRIMTLPVLLVLAILGMLAYVVALTIESIRSRPEDPIEAPLNHDADFANVTHALRRGQ
jgi:hypothetical protein